MPSFSAIRRMTPPSTKHTFVCYAANDLCDAICERADFLDGDRHHSACLRKRGGLNPAPTPAGVPVAIMSQTERNPF